MALFITPSLCVIRDTAQRRNVLRRNAGADLSRRRLFVILEMVSAETVAQVRDYSCQLVSKIT